MKAASAASLLLLFSGISVFGHGVERGKIWNGIAGSDLGFLSEVTKKEISETVTARCDLTDAVAARAEFAASDEPTAATKDQPSIRIRILVQIENRASPETIIVVATKRLFPEPGETSPMEYAVISPICR